jgi:nucleoside-diphosphate-sugar epimerase
LAAIVGEDACQTDEAEAWSTNVEGAASALEAVRRTRSPRILFVSTCSNYGIAGGLATEDSELHPLTLYARSKVQAEHLVLADPLPGACVFRLGTICGLSARMRFDLLVNDLARAAATNEPIRMFALEAWRPMLDIADAASAMLSWIQTPVSQFRSRLFNVVTENIQKKDLVSMVRHHFPEAKIRTNTAISDARDYRVSANRIQTELGFEPAGKVERVFLSIAHAVRQGMFRDPFWAGHSAIPLPTAVVPAAAAN